ncbi:nitrogen assimilation transcription factor nira [Verticillium dahliae]|nr:hypothetical protein VD0003_g9403 [Verticillium dahliae]
MYPHGAQLGVDVGYVIKVSYPVSFNGGLFNGTSCVHFLSDAPTSYLLPQIWHEFQLHQRTPPNRPSPSRSSTLGVTRRHCIKEACDACRAKKTRCDGASPCSRCAQRSLQCNYEARHPKRSLRTEIKSLKRKYQEKEDVIERLRLGHQQGNVPPCAQHDAPDSINVGKRGEETSQNFGHGHSGPVSPPSPIASPHDQRWDQVSARLSGHLAAMQYRVQDFVDMDVEASQMADELVQAGYSMYAQGLPLVATTNGNSAGNLYLPGAYLTSHDGII